jgi:hypothetical protein
MSFSGTEPARTCLTMQTPIPSGESHHELYIRTGNAGFYVRNDNRGVTLTDDRINWTFDSQEDGGPYTNIRNVHLQTGGDWRNPIGICRITFADGHVLIVTNADVRGSPDDAQRPLYREFVRDLAARLAELPQGSINFTCGLQGFRYPLIIACGVLLGIICLGVPIVVMIKTGSLLEPAGVLLAGAGLYWPLITWAEKNSPRDFNPHYPPEDLLR